MGESRRGASARAPRTKFEALETTRIIVGDCVAEMSKLQAASVDLVFADPPYAMPGEDVAAMLGALAGQGWLAPGALVIVERATRSGPVNWPDGFVPDRTRRYGEATFWYGLGPKTPHDNLASP